MTIHILFLVYVEQSTWINEKKNFLKTFKYDLKKETPRQLSW